MIYDDQERNRFDPNWQDLALVCEYFHGSTACRVRASHQTI